MAKGKDPHWIEHMHLKEGALRKETGTKPGHNISEKALRKAEHSRNPTERHRAEVAETLKHMHRKSK